MSRSRSAQVGVCTRTSWVGKSSSPLAFTGADGATSVAARRRAPIAGTIHRACRRVILRPFDVSIADPSLGSTDDVPVVDTVDGVWRRRRKPRSELQSADSGAALPAVRAERALVALAVHAQQLDERLARIEARLDVETAAAATATEAQLLEMPTHDDLLEVRLHSARVAAEVSRLAVNLRAQIDDLAVRMPAERTRVLAETILDLSDGLDTQCIDLREEPDDWAATA